MPEGVVQALGKSRSGKPTVTIDGQIYSASKVDLGHMAVGDRIVFDSASSVYNGATVWFLNAWTLISPGAKYPPVGQGASAPAYPQGATSLPRPDPIYAPAPSGAVIDAERPCISNWGAELIKAGIIKDPADLGIWVTAIKNVLR